MTRLVATGVVSAAILGLVTVEVAALVLAAVALIVSGSAYGIAATVRRSLRDAIEDQSMSARALEAAAGRVDSKIRDSDV